MPQWGDKDGTFLLGEFYHIVMDALLDLDDEWVAETLAWWRKYVSPSSGLHMYLSLKPLHSTGRYLVSENKCPPSHHR